MENFLFVVEACVIAVVIVLAAYFTEKLIKRKNDDRERVLSTRKVVVIGVFSAVSAVLMLFEIPLPFAPAFYKLDFSELPVLVGAFAYGPVAGVMTEFIKILLKLVMKGTSTAFVGELANFLVGVSFAFPASLIYLYKKNKKTAVTGCIAGTLIMTVFGTLLNAVYLLPTFADIFGMPLEVIIEMGTKINPRITNVASFVIWAVAPLNLLKGFLVSLITIFIYKPLSPILKGSNK